VVSKVSFFLGFRRPNLITAQSGWHKLIVTRGGRRTQKNYKKPGPGRMAETTRPLIRATSRAEVDVIGAQLCSCARAIFPWKTLSWSARSFPLIIVDNCPHIHNTASFQIVDYFHGSIYRVIRIWGYRDLARLLGESRWSKKWGDVRRKKLHRSRNSCIVNGRSCGWIVTVNSGLKCAHSWN